MKLNGQVKEQKNTIAERISEMNNRCEEISDYYIDDSNNNSN